MIWQIAINDFKHDIVNLLLKQYFQFKEILYDICLLVYLNGNY
jgi:hypothetical protein